MLRAHHIRASRNFRPPAFLSASCQPSLDRLPQLCRAPPITEGADVGQPRHRRSRLDAFPRQPCGGVFTLRCINSRHAGPHHGSASSAPRKAAATCLYGIQGSTGKLYGEPCIEKRHPSPLCLLAPSVLRRHSTILYGRHLHTRLRLAALPIQHVRTRKHSGDAARHFAESNTIRNR
jgi:hypothetical protein